MNVRLMWTALAATMGLGIALTVWGLANTTWTTSEMVPLRFALVSAIAVAIGAQVLNKPPILIGAAVCGAIAVACGALWPLLVLLWFALASSLLGNSILSLLRGDSRGWPTSLLIGSALFGSSVGLLAHFPFSYPGVYGAALLAPIVLGRRTLREWISIGSRWISESQRSNERETHWLECGITVVALVHFAVALMPEVGHDALATHLFVPGHLAQRHEWGFDARLYVWAVMPMLGDWIFSIGYMLGGETASRLINVGFIFVLAKLVNDLVAWAGGNASGKRWAVLLFLTTPLTFTESSSLYIESIWASFVVAGSLAIFRLTDSSDRQPDQAPVAGVLLGAALAAKAVTFTVLPVLLIVLALRFCVWMPKTPLRHFALGCLSLLALGAIPYLTAWYLAGNPVFPFFNQIFQSPLYPAAENFEDAQFGRGISWTLIYDATFHTESFIASAPGGAGFQWLVLFVPGLIALLFTRHRRGLALFAVAGISIAATFQAEAYLRYVFPSFAWAAAGIGVAATTVASHSPIARTMLFVIAAAVAGLNLAFFESATPYGGLSLHALMSPSGREAYLEAHLPIRNAVELVNRVNTRQTPVAVLALPLAAPLAADALYPIWYNPAFQKLVNEASSPEAIKQLLAKRGVEFVILDEGWGTAAQRTNVETATDRVAEFGPISVRAQKREYHFDHELLNSTDFSSRVAWSIAPGAAAPPGGGIYVSLTAPGFQIVQVAGGQRYLLTVQSTCASQIAQGRLQINWLDSHDSLIAPDVRLFDCSDADEVHSMEVFAPREATRAVVYATGHTSEPIIFKSISFKQASVR